MLITHLKNLANEAAQRGEDRAAVPLNEAAQMLYEDGVAAAALAQRRTADADRQERRRHRQKEPPVTLGHVTSRDKRDLPGFSPTPPFPAPLATHHNTPREASDDEQRNGIYSESVDNLISILAPRLGDGWADVDAFVKRRGYATWKAWFKEMLTLITGGLATEADLVQACRDDEALPDPIATPKGLRGFVRSAMEERRNRGQSAPSVARRAGGVEHWTDKRERLEKEAGERTLVQQRWGNVEQRKLKPDGDAWWRRMNAEAKGAGKNAVLYAYERLNEPAEVNRASA